MKQIITLIKKSCLTQSQQKNLFSHLQLNNLKLNSLRGVNLTRGIIPTAKYSMQAFNSCFSFACYYPFKIVQGVSLVGSSLQNNALPRCSIQFKYFFLLPN